MTVYARRRHARRGQRRRATVAEDAAATAVDVLANDTDIDAGPKTITSVDASRPRHRRASPRAAPASPTSPTPNFNGTDSLHLHPQRRLHRHRRRDRRPRRRRPGRRRRHPDRRRGRRRHRGRRPGQRHRHRRRPEGHRPPSATPTTAPSLTDGARQLQARDANYNGTDAFTYTLNGGSTATVAVTVDPVDDKPVAVDDA